MVTLDTPTVSVLMGQGSGGPALAMVPADRVLAAANGWLAPLPPEGASAIVFRDTAHAAELAAAQGVRSTDLLRAGIVDVIVPEHPDAADEPRAFTQRLSTAIGSELPSCVPCPASSGCRPGWTVTDASGSGDLGAFGNGQRYQTHRNHRAHTSIGGCNRSMVYCRSLRAAHELAASDTTSTPSSTAIAIHSRESIPPTINWRSPLTA